MDPKNMIFDDSGKVQIVHKDGTRRWSWPVDAREIVECPGSSYSYASKAGNAPAPSAVAPKKAAVPVAKEAEPEAPLKADPVPNPAPRAGAVRGTTGK